MKNKSTQFQTIFGDANRIKVLEFYLESGNVAFPVEAIVEEKEIGKSQTYQIVKDLVRKHILLEDKIYDKKRFYKLDISNKLVIELKKLFNQIITR